jgi:serine/threonine protein kinase
VLADEHGVQYMAPEVCCGLPATAQSDQYSLAVTAYEVLGGRHPFVDFAGDVKQAHVETEPAPLRTLAPGVSPRVAEAIHRGLAKDPRERFAEIRQLTDVDARSRDSFERATALIQVLRAASDRDTAVQALTQQTDLSDRSIATLLSAIRQPPALRLEVAHNDDG